MTRQDVIKELKWVRKVNQRILDTDAKEINLNSAWITHWKKVIEALDFAINSLKVDEQYQLEYERKAAGRWIDIHDKMPDYDLDFVLICFGNGFIDVATTDYVLDYEGSNQIIAWMPLPEPYKGAE